MSDVEAFLHTSNSNKLLAFDYETTGLTFHDTIVGVSFVDAATTAGVYFSFKTCSKSVMQAVLNRIAARPSIAHNAQFEQWMTHNTIGKYANVQYDTQALLNQVEGDYASNHGAKGLKSLQVELLGWEDKGDVALDAWLTEKGYVNARGKVLKGEMHRAPDHILGHYCNMDAQATWDLYQGVFAPVLERFPELDVYHTRDFQMLIKLIDRARRNGLTIDRDRLNEHHIHLSTEMARLRTTFRYHSEATPHIEQYNKNIVIAHYDKMPPKITKAGNTSVRYDKWAEKKYDLEQEDHFNVNSKDQLAWLFFDCLFHTEIKTKHDQYGNTKSIVHIEGVGKVECTKTGKRSVDKKILPKLGEAGKLLAEYNKLSKELGYVTKMLERSTCGTHDTQLRVSGTKTDRCAGTGGLNIQQLPKSRAYLECLVPREGHQFVQMDVDALEPVVLAELSNCPSYMSLFGPGRPPNDVYLFIAANIPQFAEEIKNAGYDPEKPTAEGIDRAKKQCKRIRTICKVIHLAAGYGAGAAKIYEGLRSSGVEITLGEVTEIRDMYWKVFQGVVDFRERLTAEWQANKGFFLDGIGTPVTVEEDYKKDILNRGIQRAGHMILVKYLYHLSVLNPKAEPVVPDFHDETIWECKTEDVEDTISKFNEAWRRTNEELGGLIPLSGTPEACMSFAYFKCE